MLRVRLIGTLEVVVDGAVIDSPASKRPWAVLAYLALAERGVPRAELAARFWPDVLDQSARASLRSALWAVRRELGERLVVDRARVQLHDPDGVWVDVWAFERLSERDPTRALELCRGELLEGIDDEWALAARERHRERVIELLERLAEGCERRDEGQEAIKWTRRQLEHDPFSEEAQRRLIVRLEAAGDRAGALRSYQAYAQRLRRELGVAPSAPTRELVSRLRAESSAPAVGAVPSPTSGQPALVGREHELELLGAAWGAAVKGPGGVVLLSGEAGIGKTRLAGELQRLAVAGGAHTATCAALDLGGSAPLSLWAELVRELLPVLPAPPAESTWPEDVAVLVGDLPSHFARDGSRGNAVAPDLQRTRLFEAVVALLGWATAAQPLLLVLEDIHAADRPSLELAGYVARRVANLPVMMLLTRRALPPSAAADGLEQALRGRGFMRAELALEPLPDAPIAALVRGAARLSEDQVRQVVGLAEGNALLASETARALARGEGAVSSGLRGSVRITLAPLQGEVRRLVELAAVAARPLEPVELEQLSLFGGGEAAAAALDSGLLVAADGRVGFRHALLRDAVYQEIAEPRRRGLHQRWAQALLDSERRGGIPRPAEAARQLRLAGCDADAVPQLARAASAARTVAALEQAVDYLQEALAIAPDRSDLWLETGELEAWRGHRDLSETAFQRAIGLLEQGEPLVLARAWLRRARAYHGPICLPAAVLESSTKALELLERSEAPAPEEHSEALAASAWSEAVAGRIEEAERLIARLESAPFAGADLRTYDVGHARALVLMRRGRFGESYAPSIAAGEAIARAGRLDLAFACWADAAAAAAAAGEHERALEFVDRGLTAVAGQGLQSPEIHLLAARSFLLTRLDRLQEAGEAVQAEYVLAEQIQQPELIAMASHDRGLLALRVGDYQQAATLLGDALVDRAPISRPMTRLALAEALARGGQPDRAAEELRAMVLEPVAPSDFPDALVPRLARAQGLIALARERFDEAERRLAESLAGWERLFARARRSDSITTVLADLGRPVVGLVEPERELARVRDELHALKIPASRGGPDAVLS